MAEAATIAKKLAAGPSVAYSLIKNLIREATKNNLRDQSRLEGEYQAVARKTEGHAEAKKAFSEKREPLYTGR